jgi:hypothetical protein
MGCDSQRARLTTEPLARATRVARAPRGVAGAGAADPGDADHPPAARPARVARAVRGPIGAARAHAKARLTGEAAGASAAIAARAPLGSRLANGAQVPLACETAVAGAAGEAGAARLPVHASLAGARRAARERRVAWALHGADAALPTGAVQWGRRDLAAAAARAEGEEHYHGKEMRRETAPRAATFTHLQFSVPVGTSTLTVRGRRLA